jgi:hypothetical protein
MVVVQPRLIMLVQSHKRFSYADAARIHQLKVDEVRLYLDRLHRMLPPCRIRQADPTP